MQYIRGRVAVVTGAGSGIGRAIALALADKGAHIFCADINLESAEATAREIETLGVSAKAFHCDVSDAEQVQAMAKACTETLGAATIVINNAGVALAGPVANMSLEDWHWQLGPNLFGVIHGVHAFLPQLLERQEGHIVNIASVAGLVGVANLAAYCTTKHAVVGLGESLHFELADQGIGVTTVCPGFIDTNIFKATRTLNFEMREHLLKRVAMKPEDLAVQVVDAIEKNKKFVVITGHARFLHTMKRSFPKIWRRFGLRVAKANAKRVG